MSIMLTYAFIDRKNLFFIQFFKLQNLSKADNSNISRMNFHQILHENICCRYSEAIPKSAYPYRGNSKEYLQHVCL